MSAEPIPYPAFPRVQNNDMSFRLVFPEFSDKNVYPEATLAFWAAAGLATLNRERWGDWYGLGLYLYVAHNLILAGQAAKIAARGGDPGGAAIGILSNKSVGDVSLGYSTDGLLDKEAGVWNRTVYGQRYYELRQQVGMGPLQIGTGNQPRSQSAMTVGAWAGPPLWTTWYGNT